MKRVLVYGDSNSWGYPADNSGIRMNDRWPQIMADQMDIDVIEETLPGRTIVHDDAEHMGEVNNGKRFLEVALRSHAPLDAVIILLGTNDFKARFEPTAEKIAANLLSLAKMVQSIGGGSIVWDDPTPPKIFLIAPPPLSERADDPRWDRHLEWRGGREASRGLVAALKAQVDQAAIPVFDSAPFVEGGTEDPIHWTGPSHRRLGNAVAEWLSIQLP
ncbi:MAG: GDSL-type esterase/lipase family protein [Paracoccaceae bacterium]|nr:GDSL-type esterase/lipase family protein [Paracoccaceae bacterium]